MLETLEATRMSLEGIIISALAEVPLAAIKAVFNYELIRGNELWRFALVLAAVLVTMVIGRVIQFAVAGIAEKRRKKKGTTLGTLLLTAMSKPLYVAVFALGVFLAKIPLYFDESSGINPSISIGWTKITKVLAAISVAYALYRLVDVIEYYLNRLVSKTETKLDDMLVPIVRKALRITISIIAFLLIAENILGAENVKSILLSAGIGGVAIALAAKDTIANFFGSVTIFTDKPFQMGELVTIANHTGAVEEVGFRSTRLRTLKGHQVTIPNSMITSTVVENIGRRPSIRRTSDITITYDSGPEGAEKAVAIIKEILAGVPEINKDPEKPPRVNFSEFNDWSLNICMNYWMVPADYWLSLEIAEKVNLEMMRRFRDAGIEFAFPSQTLYVKKDD